MLIYELIAGFLPFIAGLSELFMIDKMLLEQANANTLVQIDQVVLYFNHILILTTSNAGNINHISNL